MNENMTYEKFKELLIMNKIKMNNSGIRKKARVELNKLRFKPDTNVLKFVNTTNKYLRIANPAWDEETIARGIVDLLPKDIGSELEITHHDFEVFLI